MILTGPEIDRAHKAGRLTIEPYSARQLNPNSYDFRLGETIRTYRSDWLDPRRQNPTDVVPIPAGGLVLTPGRIYLGHTLEVMGSDHYVPIIRAKSSIARLGLFVHVTADLIDIGSHNQWTLQLNPIQSVRVYPCMLIGQVTFWVPTGRIELYNGKYQGSRGPIESLAYVDFEQVDTSEDDAREH